MWKSRVASLGTLLWVLWSRIEVAATTTSSSSSKSQNHNSSNKGHHHLYSDTHDSHVGNYRSRNRRKWGTDPRSEERQQHIQDQERRLRLEGITIHPHYEQRRRLINIPQLLSTVEYQHPIWNSDNNNNNNNDTTPTVKGNNGAPLNLDDKKRQKSHSSSISAGGSRKGDASSGTGTNDKKLQLKKNQIDEPKHIPKNTRIGDAATNQPKGMPVASPVIATEPAPAPHQPTRHPNSDIRPIRANSDIQPTVAPTTSPTVTMAPILQPPATGQEQDNIPSARGGVTTLSPLSSMTPIPNTSTVSPVMVRTSRPTKTKPMTTSPTGSPALGKTVTTPAPAAARTPTPPPHVDQSRETDAPTLTPVVDVTAPTPTGPTTVPTTVAPVTEPTATPVQAPFIMAGSSPPTQTSTQLQLSRTEQLLLSNALQGGIEFINPVSYQSKALHWLNSLSNTTKSLSDTQLLQRYGLACIYFATSNVSTPFTNAALNNQILPWSRSRGWVTDSDPCTWANIECNSDNTTGLVTSLDLYANFVSGEFPNEVVFLKDSLEILDLGDNFVFTRADVFNEYLGQLTHMKDLRYENTNFISNVGIPVQLSNLKLLEYYSCSNVRYAGAIDSNAFSADMIALEYIEFEYNSFGSIIPPSIASLPALKFLYARYALLQGGLDFMIGMPAIEECWVDSNPGLQGSIPSALGSLSTLASISVTECSLSGALPPELGQLSDVMEQMYFYDNHLSSTIPEEWGSFKQLNRLEMELNHLEGYVPTAICLQTFASLTSLTADCVNCPMLGYPCCTSCFNDGNEVTP